MKKMIFILLLSILGFSIICNANETNNIIPIKKVEPKLIASFKVGNGPNEIPNYMEEGGLSYSPRNFLLDNKNNYYIFIYGLNSIIKISSNGKIISNFNLDKYATFISSICLDKETNKFYAISPPEQKIIVFDTNFTLLNDIDISFLIKKENLNFNRIKVINNNIYIYSFGINNCLIINNINEKKYEKTSFFKINNNFIIAIAPYSEINNKKDRVFRCINNKNQNYELNLPQLSERIIWGSFIFHYNSSLYLYLQTTIDDTSFFDRLLIINSDNNVNIIGLKSGDCIFGSEEPLLDYDINYNIYQVCLENKRFNIYFYKFQ